MKAIDNILKKMKAYSKSNVIDINKYNEIKALGDRLIEEAFESKKPNNDLYNQHDAFAYAIFYNGTLIGDIGYLEPEMSKGEPNHWKRGKKFANGRQAAEAFVKEYDAPSKGLTLLVCNGMFYSYIQDNLWKWRVITQIEDELTLFAQKYKGSKVERVGGI